jgi:hypothetical protein
MLPYNQGHHVRQNMKRAYEVGGVRVYVDKRCLIRAQRDGENSAAFGHRFLSIFSGFSPAFSRNIPGKVGA